MASRHYITPAYVWAEVCFPSLASVPVLELFAGKAILLLHCSLSGTACRVESLITPVSSAKPGEANSIHTQGNDLELNNLTVQREKKEDGAIPYPQDGTYH